MKAMAQGQPDLSIIQDCSSEQLTQQLPMLVSLAAPDGLSSAAQLDQEQFVVLEVSVHWTYTLKSDMQIAALPV